jgi:hypothetical protein
MIILYPAIHLALFILIPSSHVAAAGPAQTAKKRPEPTAKAPIGTQSE